MGGDHLLAHGSRDFRHRLGLADDKFERRPARGVDNRLAELGRAPDRPPFPDYPIAYDAGKALHAAAKAQGNYDYAPQWAGQAVRLSGALPAAELVATLMREVAQAAS